MQFPRIPLASMLLATVLGLTGCGGGGGGGSSSSQPTQTSQSTAGYWTGTYQTGTTTQNALTATRYGLYAYVFAANGGVDTIYYGLLPDKSDGPNFGANTSPVVFKNLAGNLQITAVASVHVPTMTAGVSLTAPAKLWNWDGVGASPLSSTLTPDASGTFVMNHNAQADRVISLADITGNYVPFLDTQYHFDSPAMAFSLDASGNISATLADGCTFLGSAALNQPNTSAMLVSGSIFGTGCAETATHFSGNGLPIFSSDGKLTGLLITMLDLATLKPGLLFHLMKQ